MAKLNLNELLNNDELVEGLARSMKYDTQDTAKGLSKKEFVKKAVTEQVFQAALQGLALIKADEAAQTEMEAQKAKYSV